MRLRCELRNQRRRSLLSIVLIACFWSGIACSQSDCWSGAELDGEFCYPKCKVGYTGVGPLCWQNCPLGFVNDGATCRKDVQILSADNSRCPWYDKCGLALSKGCSSCPAGFHNDGCTCRKDVEIFAARTYGRGAGFLQRSRYRDVFELAIRDHRNIWLSRAQPLTVAESTYLRRFFPARLVDNLRVFEMIEMTGAFNFNAAATTYGKDFITIKSGNRSLPILKHELVHACQYEHLGSVEAFAHAYADQFVDGGYEYRNIQFEREAFQYAAISDDVTPPIDDFLEYCGTFNSKAVVRH